MKTTHSESVFFSPEGCRSRIPRSTYFSWTLLTSELGGPRPGPPPKSSGTPPSTALPQGSARLHGGLAGPGSEEARVQAVAVFPGWQISDFDSSRTERHRSITFAPYRLLAVCLPHALLKICLHECDFRCRQISDAGDSHREVRSIARKSSQTLLRVF